MLKHIILPYCDFQSLRVLRKVDREWRTMIEGLSDFYISVLRFEDLEWARYEIHIEHPRQFFKCRLRTYLRFYPKETGYDRVLKKSEKIMIIGKTIIIHDPTNKNFSDNRKNIEPQTEDESNALCILDHL
jgi:hypothetical protein